MLVLQRFSATIPIIMIKFWALLLLGAASVNAQVPWDDLNCDCGCIKNDCRPPCDTAQVDNRRFNKYAGFTNPSCRVTQISDLPDCSARTIGCDTIWNCCNINGIMNCTVTADTYQRVTTGKCRNYKCADTDDTCCYKVECLCYLPSTTPQMITTSPTCTTKTTTAEPATTTPPATTKQQPTITQHATQTEEFDSTPPIDINTEQIRTTSPENKDPTPPSKPEKTLTTSGDKNPAIEKPSKPNSGTTFHGIDKYLLILLFLMAAIIAIQV